MKLQKTLIIKLLLGAIILISVIIVTVLIRKAVLSSAKETVALEKVILRFEPSKASYPIRKVQFVSIIVFMPAGKQITAVDLVLKAKGVAIEPAGSIEPLEPDTGVFKEILKEKKQDGYHISYLSLQEERFLPRIAKIHLAVERSEPGEVTISVDKSKSTIVGTPDLKAFVIDSDSAQYDFR